MMKKITLTFIALVAMIQFSTAQDKPASPKAQISGESGAATVKIVYCQPSARGRQIMGSLVPYGEVWRTGANEATTIEFDKPVKIEGKEVAAGKYALFTIPGETEWTIILNKDSKQWGAYKYNEKDDVLRVKVKSAKASAFVETFTIQFINDEINLSWENTSVSFKIKG